MATRGRNLKTNFDFFRLDTNLFSNKKIKALRRSFGSVGILTYLYILSYAYGNDGYYIKIDSVEDFAYDIAESISNSNLTQVASVATDCMNYLASRGEINKHLLDKGVISGESIQRQYIEMCIASKRKVEIKEEYRLVEYPEFLIQKNGISSEEIAVSSGKNQINSEEMRQKKGKESKYIYSSSSSYNPPKEIPMSKTAIAIQKFFNEFHIINLPNTDMQAFTLENLPILTDKFRRISWLGSEKHDSKWVAERAEQISEGVYDYSIDRDYTVCQEVDENGKVKEVVSYRPVEKPKKNIAAKNERKKAQDDMFMRVMARHWSEEENDEGDFQ